jgi:broad specificity phosphatase PhoE
MKLFLIRHGETTGDVEDRYGGSYDDDLTPRGQQQAEELAKKLANEGIQKIFCSPLARARQTAEYVRVKTHAEVVELHDVRERNHYGVLSGMTKADAKRDYPELVGLVADKYSTVEGGEPYKDFGVRVESAFAEIQNSNHDTIAVLTHGGVLRYIFRDILGLGEIKVGDCGFAEFRIIDGSPELIKADGIIVLDNNA